MYDLLDYLTERQKDKNADEEGAVSVSAGLQPQIVQMLELWSEQCG